MTSEPTSFTHNADSNSVDELNEAQSQILNEQNQNTDSLTHSNIVNLEKEIEAVSKNADDVIKNLLK